MEGGIRGDIHKRIVDTDNKHFSGILQFGVSDIPGNMRIRARWAYPPLAHLILSRLISSTALAPRRNKTKDK